LFLDVEILKNAKAGNFNIVFKNKTTGKQVEKTFELLARNINSASRPSFNNSDVIYLLTPDRFANGDLTNDSNPTLLEKANRTNKDGRHGGDIKGLKEHLNYIQNLGVTAIWPMPLLENNQSDFTYHGYAISDFYKIDPRFGTNELYKQFVSDAKTKNLKVIKDLVLNHCGSSHWWMADLPSKDWINNEAVFMSTNHLHEAVQDIHASKKDLQKQVEGWFVPSMPDMNQKNEFLSNYLIQNTIWWIEYADLAGLRIDTYPYSEKKFLAKWNKAILSEYPNINIVAEEWSLKPSLISYWQKNKNNKDAYKSELPTLMDFPMQNALIDGLLGEEVQNEKGLTKIYQTLSEDFLYPNPNNLVVFADNHDINRFFTQVNGNVDLFKMGMVYLLTTRGIPQIFYGTEIGLQSPDIKSDGEIRKDMPGGWPDDTTDVFSQKNLKTQQTELYNFVQKILLWRKTATAIHDGQLIQFAPNNGIYSYFRFNKKEKYWIIFNKNKEPKTLNNKDYEELLPKTAELFDIYSNAQLLDTNKVTIAANGFLILKVS
jgi:neopullulanase